MFLNQAVKTGIDISQQLGTLRNSVVLQWRGSESSIWAVVEE
jgi:hypothetical protein